MDAENIMKKADIHDSKDYFRDVHSDEENEKNVSLLPEKNNNFFLAFFLFCFRQKKTSLLFIRN